MIKLLKTWLREIRAVGLHDWWWFVVVLERDEFHVRLSLDAVIKFLTLDDALDEALKKLDRNRQRAHRIDMTLRELT